MLSKKLIFGIVCLGYLNLQAGVLFIEPSLGIRNQTLKLTSIPSGIETKIEAKSTPTAGLKLGHQTQFGLDINLSGEYSKGTATADTLPTEKLNYTQKTGAVQLGVSAMNIIKIYLGYVALNEFIIEDSGLVSGFNISGTGYQAGIALFLTNNCTLDVQYNINNYKKITGLGFNSGDDISTYFSKVESQDYTIKLGYRF